MRGCNWRNRESARSLTILALMAQPEIVSRYTAPMTTHPQAGKEPAEDLRRRFTDAIRAVDWTPNQKHVIRLRDRDSRAVFVEGVPPGWKGTYAPLELVGFVRSNGDLEGKLRVHCLACTGGSFEESKSAPRLHGGQCDGVEGLHELLKTAIQQRELVLRRIRKGEPEPYLVDGWRWDSVMEVPKSRHEQSGDLQDHV